MDLYQKKNNVPSSRTQRSRDNYDETNNNQPSRYRYSQTRDNNAISQDNYRNYLLPILIFELYFYSFYSLSIEKQILYDMELL